MNMQWQYLMPVGVSAPNGTTANGYQVDASATSATEARYDVRGWTDCCVQAVFNKGASTAVFTIKRSLDGQNAFGLESAQTLTVAAPLSTKIDVKGIGYLHLPCTTGESGSTATLFVLVKDATRS